MRADTKMKGRAGDGEESLVNVAVEEADDFLRVRELFRVPPPRESQSRHHHQDDDDERDGGGRKWREPAYTVT